MRGRLFIALTAAALVAGVAVIPAVAQGSAQTPPPTPQPAAATSQPLPTESLDHIKAALSHPPAVKLAGDKMRFYLEVYGTPSPFWSFVGSYDLKNGPLKYGPMTGQEFLNMMRPKELYSSAGITAPELMQFALTNIAAQALIKKAVQDIRNAHNEAEVQRIRARIDAELRALKGGGQ
jgi:hypothetical protein